MNAIELKDKLCLGLRESSGLEARRSYLGMSGIGQCPRKLYLDFVQGRSPATDQQHWFCWTGYMHEAGVLRLLGLPVETEQVEVVAKFDERFRGHVDRSVGDVVLEIKSVGWDKFVSIREDRRPLKDHAYQVQCYLRHGVWVRALMVYVARDVPFKYFDGPPFWVFEVSANEELADKLDQKAREVLVAIDRKDTPACTCGWCQR